MKKFAVLLLLVFAATAYGQVDVSRVADDAIVVDRVAQAAKRDLPNELLKRIVNEDIDILRGKRADGSYQYARYERIEAGRVTNSFSVQPHGEDKLEQIEIRGPFVYRATLESPNRRMVVTHNRKVWVDRVDIEYIPEGSGSTKVQTVKVEGWLEPGQTKSFDLNEIARQATVRVFARADASQGYGNIVVSLIQAKVVDNPESPYSDAVSSAKAIVRALDNDDIPSIRAMASRMRDGLGARPATRTVDVVAAAEPPRPAPPAATAAAPAVAAAAPAPEVLSDLTSIEDLLTGSDAEKREGLEKLHQLIRRLRQK